MALGYPGGEEGVGEVGGDGLPGGEEGGATDGGGLPLEDGGGDGLPGVGEEGDCLTGVLGGGALEGDGGPGDEGGLERRTLRSLWPAMASASRNSPRPRTTVALKGMLPRTRPSTRH